MSVYDMNEERDIGQSKVQVLEDRTNPLPLPFPTPKYRPWGLHSSFNEIILL